MPLKQVKTMNISNLYIFTHKSTPTGRRGKREDDSMPEGFCHFVLWHTGIHHIEHKKWGNFKQQRI